MIKVMRLMMPWRCMLCHAKSDQDKDLCTDCERGLPWLDHSTVCRQCGLNLVGAERCGQCLQHPPLVTRCVGLWDYNACSAHLIHQLKFSHQLYVARIMGQLLAEQLKQHCTDWPEVMIPVPLHSKRLRERGFNQSMLLAKFLRKELRIAIDNQSCRRARHTHAQSDLSKDERRHNVTGAFAVKLLKPYHHVSLIDDVVTTMSTCNELAHALIEAGVGRVDVWSCVRTQH